MQQKIELGDQEPRRQLQASLKSSPLANETTPEAICFASLHR